MTSAEPLNDFLGLNGLANFYPDEFEETSQGIIYKGYIVISNEHRADPTHNNMVCRCWVAREQDNQFDEDLEYEIASSFGSFQDLLLEIRIYDLRREWSKFQENRRLQEFRDTPPEDDTKIYDELPF